MKKKIAMAFLLATLAATPVYAAEVQDFGTAGNVSVQQQPNDNGGSDDWYLCKRQTLCKRRGVWSKFYESGVYSGKRFFICHGFVFTSPQLGSFYKEAVKNICLSKRIKKESVISGQLRARMLT